MPGEMIYQDVPSFNRRHGDNVISGRNNSTIVLGRDRIDKIDSGNGDSKDAGSIHFVVGRQTGDFSLADDSATLILSMKSQPDESVGLSPNNPASVMVARADRIIMVPRDQLIIKVGQASITISSDGSVIIDGNISLGKDATEKALKGNSFVREFMLHIHPDPATGFTGTPVQQISNSVYSEVVELR